jgi:hypothetical protein
LTTEELLRETRRLFGVRQGFLLFSVLRAAPVTQPTGLLASIWRERTLGSGNLAPVKVRVEDTIDAVADRVIPESS